MKSLSDRLVVVTGAATGVGRGLAREAAARGAEVVVADINDPSETVSMIEASGGRARGMTCDVRDPEALRILADDVCGDDGTINVVCANAGVGVGATIDTITDDDLRDIFEVNVLGVLRTAKAFLPALRRARTAGEPASLLITGSEHSLGVPPFVSPMFGYTTSKHALLGLAACMRRDLEPEGIHVSIVCPSYVRTERLRSYAEADPGVAKTIKMYGQDVEDVARAAFDGLDAGAFVLPTNPVSRDFVVDFHGSVVAAMEAVDAR